jgi:hypothetical protein
MPEGLEIDHSKPLNGTMASYADQVLICTGKEDWTSRIEDENGGDNLAANIKNLLGRGGIYSDVRILIMERARSIRAFKRGGCQEHEISMLLYFYL